MAPVLRASSRSVLLRPTLISLGQHGELLDETFRSLDLAPAHELAVMEAGQTPNDVLQRVLERLPPLLQRIAPSVVVVQGDTSGVLAASLVAYNLRIPVAHVEAGLRTHDHEQPFPEEGNRQIVDRLATWCFAPTRTGAENLAAEGIPAERIHVTGNTAVDSVVWALSRATYRCEEPTLVLTLHRRESFGSALEQVLLGVKDFLDETPNARVLWPVHPNPPVLEAAERALPSHPRLDRIDPLGYVDFIGALASCRTILTDSGGIQEEAPSLGKPVIIARDKTARTEPLEHGRHRLAGRTRAEIRRALVDTWSAPPFEGAIPAPNPFGDGHAAERIVSILEAAAER
jgi:UDP-N-acetylglucosamine 2-epimerase (non-hydrolysing)